MASMTSVTTTWSPGRPPPEVHDIARLLAEVAEQGHRFRVGVEPIRGGRLYGVTISVAEYFAVGFGYDTSNFGRSQQPLELLHLKSVLTDDAPDLRARPVERLRLVEIVALEVFSPAA